MTLIEIKKALEEIEAFDNFFRWDRETDNLYYDTEYVGCVNELYDSINLDDLHNKIVEMTNIDKKELFVYHLEYGRRSYE